MGPPCPAGPPVPGQQQADDTRHRQQGYPPPSHRLCAWSAQHVASWAWHAGIVTRQRAPPGPGDVPSPRPLDAAEVGISRPGLASERGTGVFGERRRERREEREATRYQMRQRMISIGDDYVIENDRGERVFRLDGKALRIRKTILFEDMDGHELAKIQERMLHVRDSMEIEGPDR